MLAEREANIEAVRARQVGIKELWEVEIVIDMDFAEFVAMINKDWVEVTRVVDLLSREQDCK